MIALERTALEGVLLLKTQVFRDARGAFVETFSTRRYAALGLSGPFVQDNCSISRRGALRGLHFQEPNGQGKLVQVLSGAVFDVVLDVRRGSPTFGRWVATELTGDSGRQLWIPPGFAHGFCALADAVLVYRCTAYYAPESGRVVAWNDPELAIPWPVSSPILSARDVAGARLRDQLVLPDYA